MKTFTIFNPNDCRKEIVYFDFQGEFEGINQDIKWIYTNGDATNLDLDAVLPKDADFIKKANPIYTEWFQQELHRIDDICNGTAYHFMFSQPNSSDKYDGLGPIVECKKGDWHYTEFRNYFHRITGIWLNYAQ